VPDWCVPEYRVSSYGLLDGGFGLSEMGSLTWWPDETGEFPSEGPYFYLIGQPQTLKLLHSMRFNRLFSYTGASFEKAHCQIPSTSTRPTAGGKHIPQGGPARGVRQGEPPLHGSPTKPLGGPSESWAKPKRRGRGLDAGINL